MRKPKQQDARQEALLPVDVLRGHHGRGSLEKLRTEAFSCQQCDLHTSRTTVVFGEGCVDTPPVAFVGEAPGEVEDLTGRPFVGRSGMQLMRMIAAMGFRREDVYLANATNCRPVDNRTPTKTEIRTCSHFLHGQLLAVAPKAIVCLGKVAAWSLLQDGRAIELLRGQWFEWEKIPVRVTYHPAFLIRPDGEGYRAHAWLDLQSVLIRLGLPVPTVDEARARVAALQPFEWGAYVAQRFDREPRVHEEALPSETIA